MRRKGRAAQESIEEERMTDEHWGSEIAPE
jgi:hypothetical protein